MLSNDEKINVTELLSGLELDDVLSLASTVTKGLLKSVTQKDAIEAILLHSDSVESIISRKKVSKELLFNYLHYKKVTTDNNLDKKSLGVMVMNYWQGTRVPVTEHSKTQDARNHCALPQVSSQLGCTQLEPGQVDVLALKFSEWFYQLLNKDFLEGGDFAVGAEHFWSDATLQMRLSSGGQESCEEAQGDSAVVGALNGIKERHRLYFCPNLSTEGVRGRAEPHGMVSVMACGTLHQSVGVVVGLFEQVFYLIKDPLTNTWKMKRLVLNLTSNTNVAKTPSLMEGQLTRTLLPIENPD